MRNRKFKLRIEEDVMRDEDREYVMNMHRHLNYLNSLPTKDEQVRSVIKAEISNIRSKLNEEMAHKFFIATVSLGPHKLQKVFPYYPEVSDLSEMKESLSTKLKEKRQYNKTIKRTVREFNGMRYEMTGLKTVPFMDTPKPKIMPGLLGGGRAFDVPGSIVKLVSSEEYSTRILRDKKPYDKAKYVGVELEIISRLSEDQLREKFVEAKLAGSVYIKRDGSLRFDEGHRWKNSSSTNQFCAEITLIAKQDNINNIINRVCAVLNSDDVEAYVNNTCGLHVHLDMRQRDYRYCYKNLYHSLDILKRMVPQNRLNNTYCVLNNTDDADMAARQNPNNAREPRYQAINAYSLGRHKTLEIRLHSGSINANKINNWVNLLCLVTDSPVLFTNTITLDDLRSIGADEKLCEFIKMRINKFTNPTIDNKQDHFETAI